MVGLLYVREMLTFREEVLSGKFPVVRHANVEPVTDRRVTLPRVFWLTETWNEEDAVAEAAERTETLPAPVGVPGSVKG